jgi:hypothetical protein
MATTIPMPALAPTERPAASSSSSSSSLSLAAELLALAAEVVVDASSSECVPAGVEEVVEEVVLVEDSAVACRADDGIGRLVLDVDVDVVVGAAAAGLGVVVTVASVAVAQNVDTKLVAWTTMSGEQACLAQSRTPNAKSGLAQMQLVSPGLQPKEPLLVRLFTQVF